MSAPGKSSPLVLAAQVQRCTLLSIKTGGCPETCTYCSQSSSWRKETGLKAEKLMDLEAVYEVHSPASLHLCLQPLSCCCSQSSCLTLVNVSNSMQAYSGVSGQDDRVHFLAGCS